MSATDNKLSSHEEAKLSLLRWGAGLAFFIVALPLPIYFLLRRLAATVPEDAAIFMWLTIISLVAGALAGIAVAIFLLLYRRSKIKTLRERIATDGITADELRWFKSELTKDERRALREIEGKNRLLADAYRETLATRLTASRVALHASREKVTIKRHIEQASSFPVVERIEAERDLQNDLTRLESIEREAQARETESRARLQMIEAAASRDATEAQTQLALRRLEAARDQPPLGLEAARQQTKARSEAQAELRSRDL
ncbi:MAG: hypothetical protein H0V88_11990 [Pyrinomonadaceae bacterium]|nr:hypothetical protein [Pyrinomonadaceae bacterium]